MDWNWLDRSEVTFDFHLPHGVDSEKDTQCRSSRATIDTPWAFEDLPVNNNTDTIDGDRNTGLDFEEGIEQDVDYHRFSPDFSDDQGACKSFDRSRPTHRAKKGTAKMAKKGRKSSRRSDTDDEDSKSRAQAKKPRQSLFGAAHAEEDEEQVDSVLTPARSEPGIDNRMSSLNLDQQHVRDEYNGTGMSTGFSLVRSEIGSVCESEALSNDEIIIPPDTVPYYELRQNIDRKKAVTHVDNDKSGNWDPEQETRERIPRNDHAKAAKKETKESRKKKGKNDEPRGYVMKCIAKLPFEAFGNVRNFTNDEQNWPDDWSEIDSEQERELREWREAYRANTPNRGLQLPLGDPANKVDDLTGYPAARGCKQCRKFEQTCSMVDGGTYPCEGCIEDGSECQPIQEPTEKGRCRQCDQASIEICSFQNDRTQPICNHCADSDQICEALPPHGYKAPRVSVDEIVWGPDRPFVSCTTCRALKKRCSLKSKGDKPPCKWCRKNGTPCRFLDPPRLDSGDQAAMRKALIKRIAPDCVKPNSAFFTAEDLASLEKRDTEIHERDATPELEMEDAEGNTGMLTKIITSFAHPIRFGSKNSALTDCNFCELPLFGMVGHFEKEVHVIRWNSGLGYAEVGGGHAQNTGETTMCTDCINQRLQILVCPRHQFERIPDTSSDSEALTDELIETETGGVQMQYQLSRWCSMCFSPAVFGCNTVQPAVCGEEEKEIAGCHLRLCLACEVALRTKFGGNFDAMAADLDSQPKISEADEALGRKIEGRPRADVGLLKQDGLLMRALQAEG